MLIEKLESDIQEFHQHLRSECPLYTNASAGKLTKKELSNYAANILYLIRYTPIYLKLSMGIAEEKGLPGLARFFFEKIGEETGHDKWAEDDVKALSGTPPQDDHAVSRHTKELVVYLRTEIERDPRLYLAYILLAEYLTVLAGPQWLEDVEKKCGIAKSSLSVVGNHVELDKEHVKEDYSALETLIEPSLLPEMRRVLRSCMAFYEGFCSEVGAVS